MLGEDSVLAAVSGPVDSAAADETDAADLLRAVYLLQHPAVSNKDTVISLMTYLSDCDVSATSVSCLLENKDSFVFVLHCSTHILTRGSFHE